MYVLTYLLCPRSVCDNHKKLFSYKISDDDMQIFARAAEEYLINQLERSFKSLEFYKEVTR